MKNPASLLSPTGPLARAIDRYESRPGQAKMLEKIFEAYEKNEIALIEAGTGVGKSISYLLPAILWAIQKQEKTVISTHTINLQEQLISKDLPLLLKALGVQIKAVIVKGINNYICKRKLDETAEQIYCLSPDEKEELEKLTIWSEQTTTGCKSDLSFTPTPLMWEKVSAESDTCTHKKCPHYEACPLIKAKKEAESANILISNHALFFRDLELRSQIDNYEGILLIPPYSRVILDEAHTIEEAATEALSMNVSFQELFRISSRLGSLKGGKIAALKDKIQSQLSKVSNERRTSILNRLILDLPSYLTELFRHLKEAFESFRLFVEVVANEERSIRIVERHFSELYWKEDIAVAVQRVHESQKTIAYSLHLLDEEFKEEDEKFLETILPLKKEVMALSARLAGKVEALKCFASSELPKDKVKWIESTLHLSRQNLTLIIADLNIADKLKNVLFTKFDTVALLSATLTSNQQFSFIKNRLGLNQLGSRVVEGQYPSPFNYQKQALLVIPNDLVSPVDPRFVQVSARAILRACIESRGNAFVLFTSFSQMNAAFTLISKELIQKGFTPIKQGDESRKNVLERFKKKEGSVLFATSSFWQGVDVAGEALRAVIIVKLPFQVPSEPLVEARLESLKSNGKSPFFEYSIPNAIVRFKQGFGRLIRNQTDRGCIVCLDSRIANKPYGKLFLKSLPEATCVIANSDDAFRKMGEFYRNK